MQHDVFISHALKDKSIADAICAKLEAADVKSWIADRAMAAGENCTAATQSAIGSSRLVVLVLSENANAAPHIEREIAHAFYARRVILTFRLAGTIPRRDFLFYLGNLPWLNAVNPPTEEQLDALTARIKGLLSHSTVILPQGSGKTTAGLSFSNSWLGALQASHYRTLGILKWVAITTCFFAGFWLLWLAFRPGQEQVPSAESHLASQASNLAPKSSPPPPGGNASASTPTYAYTRFGLWQPANGDPMPSVQPQGTPLGTPVQQTTGVAPSARSSVTPGEQAGAPAALEPNADHLASTRTHRSSHSHRSLSRVAKAQLKELEAKAQMALKKAQLAQKKAQLATRQRDALEAQLKEVKARARRAEMHADLAAKQHGAMEAELKEAEEKAQVAQQNADLVNRQRGALEAELKKAQEEKAQLAQHVADLAASRNGAANTQEREQAEPADEDADLAANPLESRQTQPPNPGQNAKTPPLIQALNSSVP